jgi:pyruvate/2-oxoacid:ferredoxin oxidoreductase beta subunit
LKKEPKKNIDFILASHKIPYIATCSPAFLDDLRSKIVKAKETAGFRFLHIFSPCPPGWKSDPKDSIAISRLAVESNVFPLYEIEDGSRYRVTHESQRLPVSEYLKLQGRFRYLSPKDTEMIQAEADRFYDLLLDLQGADKQSRIELEE